MGYLIPKSARNVKLQLFKGVGLPEAGIIALTVALALLVFQTAWGMIAKIVICCILGLIALIMVSPSFITNKNSWVKLQKENENLDCIYIDTYNNKFEFIFSTLRFLFKINDIRRVIESFSPDVLYIPMKHFWDKFVVRSVNVKCTVQTIHDVILHEGENSLQSRIIDKVFSYKTDKYIILSEVFKKDLEYRGVKADDICVIPHAVFKGYKISNKYIDTNVFHNRILFFGRIIKYKGLDVLLKALPNIVEKHTDVKLVIAGDGDISQYDEILQNCHEYVELHNRWISDDEVEGFFLGSDLVVLPYIHASQSGVVSLAYSFGVPAVVTNLGGLPEQVQNGITGIVIDPNDINQLANSINKLLDNPDLLKEMKRNALDYSDKFTWEHSAKVLVNFINNGLIC